MSAVVADTHTLIWYLDPPGNLSTHALSALQTAESGGDSTIFISAISIIEIVYLVEKGRLPTAALSRLKTALTDPLSVVAVVPIDLQVTIALESISRTQVPDMPDRIIAATAAYLNLPLVTKDTAIRSVGITTVW